MGDGWIEVRESGDGTKRHIIRDRVKVDGEWKTVTVNKNAGPWAKLAGRIHDAYKRQKAAGEHPEAQALAKTIDDALESWIKDEPKEPETIYEYRDTLKKFKAHSKTTYLNQIIKGKLDGWRFDMETGVLTYSRNPKGKDPKPKRYAEWTIWRLMRNMRAFLNFCYRQRWIGLDMTEMIRLREPESTKRFLTRPEVASLIKCCRVEKYLSPGGASRTSWPVEKEVLSLSSEYPDLGYASLAKRLLKAGIQISPGGVRAIWKRYEMLTMEQRRSRRGLRIIPIKKTQAFRRRPQANNSLRKILLTCLYTGMRVSEVLLASSEHLTREEILERLPDGRIVSILIYILFLPKTKGRRQRSIALHPTIARIIGAKKLFGKTGPIFTGWTKSKLAQARLRAVRRAKLGKVTTHGLRHSFVRNYLKSGAGTIAQLRFQTGHENLDSLQTYAHFSTKDIAATISKMKIQ